MIVYSIPNLLCECGFALVRDEEQPKIGGRMIFRCGNERCRVHEMPMAFRPVEHLVEPL